VYIRESVLPSTALSEPNPSPPLKYKLLCVLAHGSSFASPQARAQFVSKLPARKVPTAHSWQESSKPRRGVPTIRHP